MDHSIKKSIVVPYRGAKGRIVKDAYVVLYRIVEEEDLADSDAPSQNYLRYIEKLLTKAGYNVEIQTSTYIDTKTGNQVKGSMLVDKNYGGNFYHIIINGHLPYFEHGQNNPIALRKLKVGDCVKVIKHKRDLQKIDSPEFIKEEPLES